MDEIEARIYAGLLPVLMAHYATCPACAAYIRRLESIGKDLPRPGWLPLDTPWMPADPRSMHGGQYLPTVESTRLDI